MITVQPSARLSKNDIVQQLKQKTDESDIVELTNKTVAENKFRTVMMMQN